MYEEPSNQLFRFLRARFRSVGELHRTNPRRHSSRPARLSWEEAGKEREARGRLVDISRAGAGLSAAVPPPLRARVRLRLVGRESTPWIEAEVLGAEPEAAGRYRIRLRFYEACPTYFLRVAVLGPVISEPRSEVSYEPAADSCDPA